MPSHRIARRRFLQAAGLASAAALAAPLAAAQPAAKALPLKLGLASYSTRKFTLEQTIAICQRVGLPYLCLKDFHLSLKSTPAEIAAAVAKIKAGGLILYAGGVISMRKPADVDQAFAYAKAAGMKTIVAMPLPEVLPQIEQKAKELDVRVAIHNHGPGDKVWPTPECIVDKIGGMDPRIGICIDIGHTVRIGADLYQSTEKYAARIHDVHIKDVTEASPAGKGTIVGRGVIDIPRFLKILKKVDYQGVVSFEYEQEPDNPEPGLAESVEYTKKALAKI